MARPYRILPALGALILSGGLLAACGNSLPSGAIATVGSVQITKSAFDHWMVVAEKSQAAAASPTATTVAPLDPPNFTACTAYHQRTDAKPAKGQPNPTPASRKAACVQAYNTARDAAVPFLITADWLQGEAADQGIKVTNAEAASMLKTILAQRFPNPAQLQQFLTAAGETQADLLYRVRIDTISNKLRQKATSAKVTVTPAQIAAYYNKNVSQFGTPQTRDVRTVLVKTLAQANHVHALVASGQSISKIAKQDSIDSATKASGGALTKIQRGQQDKAFDAAIFGARLGQLVGPVKTAFGYEVFRLQKITPATKKTLAQETTLIRQQLIAQSQSSALTAFVNHFEAKWRSRTTCRSGYIVSDCKNGPKASTSTTATPTG